LKTLPLYALAVKEVTILRFFSLKRFGKWKVSIAKGLASSQAGSAFTVCLPS